MDSESEVKARPSLFWETHDWQKRKDLNVSRRE